MILPPQVLRVWWAAHSHSFLTRKYHSRAQPPTRAKTRRQQTKIALGTRAPISTATTTSSETNTAHLCQRRVPKIRQPPSISPWHVCRQEFCDHPLGASSSVRQHARMSPPKHAVTASRARPLAQRFVLHLRRWPRQRRCVSGCATLVMRTASAPTLAKPHRRPAP